MWTGKLIMSTYKMIMYASKIIVYTRILNYVYIQDDHVYMIT